jgi:hypothetical protein
MRAYPRAENTTAGAFVQQLHLQRPRTYRVYLPILEGFQRFVGEDSSYKPMSVEVVI